ncbi:MAG: hypothetical protein K2W95_11570 [Candidatus Obscuribacterales bacterium]|nr:hypothetical protein [Candidatus Obscuribacterales bacterium]
MADARFIEDSASSRPDNIDYDIDLTEQCAAQPLEDNSDYKVALRSLRKPMEAAMTMPSLSLSDTECDAGAVRTMTIKRDDGVTATLDSSGRVTNATNPDGVEFGCEYDSVTGRIAKFNDGVDTWSADYNAPGADASRGIAVWTSSSNEKFIGKKIVLPDCIVVSTSSDGSREIFNLTGVYEKWNNQGKLAYKLIEGIEVTFNYEADRLVSTTESDGRGVVRTFDANRKLRDVVYPGGGREFHYDEKGRLTSTKDLSGTIREFTWDSTSDGLPVLTRVIEKKNPTQPAVDRDWRFESGSWINAKDPKAQVSDVRVHADGTLTWDEPKRGIKLLERMNGEKLLEHRFGGSVKFNRRGQVVEMTTAQGENRKFEYGEPGAERANQLIGVTWPDGTRFSTNDGREWAGPAGKFTGEITINDRGDFKLVDSARNETYRSFDRRHEDVNYQAALKDMAAIQYAMNGPDGYYLLSGGINKETVFAILERNSFAQRQLIERLWNEKYSASYKHDLRAELEDELGKNSSDFQKAVNLLYRQNDTVDFAGELKYALLDREHWLSNRSAASNEKCIRETLAKMTAEQIKEVADRFQQEGLALSRVIADSSLSSATKSAAAIYLKGAESRTAADTLALANLGLDHKDLDLFAEAWAGASAEARATFMQNQGEERMKAVFGSSWLGTLTLGLSGNLTDRDYKRATDYQAFGKLSLATHAGESVGLLWDNVEAVELAIKHMADSEREAYVRGKFLVGPPAAADSVQGDAEARKFFLETRAGLVSVAGSGYSADSQKAELAKWEDHIKYKGGSLISKVLEHRGYLYNQSAESLLSSLENMGPEDLMRVKFDRQFYKDLWNAISHLEGYVIKDEPTALEDRLLKILNEKFDVEVDPSTLQPAERETFNRGYSIAKGVPDLSKLNKEERESAEFYLGKIRSAGLETARRDVLDAIDDNVHWYGRDANKIFDAVSNMKPSERENYRNNPEFRQKLEEKYKSALWTDGERKVVEELLNRISRGESRPQLSVLEKLNFRASCWTADKSQVVRDLQAAFREEPTLSKRLSDDPALLEKYCDATKRALGEQAYKQFGEKLVKTGTVDLDFQLQLNNGYFYPYESLYRDAANASDADRHALLGDETRLGKVCAALPDPEVLKNCLRQGEMRPEDKLRAYVQGFGASSAEINEVFVALRDRVKAREELEKLPAFTGKEVTDEAISGYINARLSGVRTAYANKYGESLSERLASELGGADWAANKRIARDESTSALVMLQETRNEHYDTFSNFSSIADRIAWDSNPGLVKSLNNEIQQQQVLAAATGRELPIEKAREMAAGLLSAIDLQVQSEQGLIDTGVDAAITAATLALLVPSGGSSVSLMALGRFPQLARGLAAVARATEGLTQAYRVESIAKYLQSAKRVVELGAAGIAGGALKVGAHEALDQRYDLSRQGMVTFADGFVTTVGNLVGAGDLAAAQGLFRTAGEAAAARLTSVFFQNEGRLLVAKEAGDVARKGVAKLLRESLVAGSDAVDPKSVAKLAEQLVSPDLAGATRVEAVCRIASEINRTLQEEMVAQSKNVYRRFAREFVLNVEGGALGGAGGSAVHWDSEVSIEENLGRIAAGGAAGGAMAGAFTVGLQGASAGLSKISKKEEPTIEKLGSARSALKQEQEKMKGQISELEDKAVSRAEKDRLEKLREAVKSNERKIGEIDTKVKGKLQDHLEGVSKEIHSQRDGLERLIDRHLEEGHQVDETLRQLKLERDNAGGAAHRVQEIDERIEALRLRSAELEKETLRLIELRKDADAALSRSAAVSGGAQSPISVGKKENFSEERLRSALEKSRMFEIAIRAERGELPATINPVSSFYLRTSRGIPVEVRGNVSIEHAFEILDKIDNRIEQPGRLELINDLTKPFEGEAKAINGRSVIVINFDGGGSRLLVYDHEMGHVFDEKVLTKSPSVAKVTRDAYIADLQKSTMDGDFKNTLSKHDYIQPNAHPASVGLSGKAEVDFAYLSCRDEVVAEAFKLFYREKESGLSLTYREMVEKFVLPERRHIMLQFENTYKTLKAEAFEPGLELRSSVQASSKAGVHTSSTDTTRSHLRSNSSTRTGAPIKATAEEDDSFIPEYLRKRKPDSAPVSTDLASASAGRFDADAGDRPERSFDSPYRFEKHPHQELGQGDALQRQQLMSMGVEARETLEDCLAAIAKTDPALAEELVNKKFEVAPFGNGKGDIDSLALPSISKRPEELTLGIAEVLAGRSTCDPLDYRVAAHELLGHLAFNNFMKANNLEVYNAIRDATPIYTATEHRLYLRSPRELAAEKIGSYAQQQKLERTIAQMERAGESSAHLEKELCHLKVYRLKLEAEIKTQIEKKRDNPETAKAFRLWFEGVDAFIKRSF